MDGKPAAVLVIGLFTQQIEKLCIAEGDQEIEGIVRIAHYEEQRRFPVPQGVQLQLVIHGNVPDLLNIEGGKPGPAAHQDALCGFA